MYYGTVVSGKRRITVFVANKIFLKLNKKHHIKCVQSNFPSVKLDENFYQLKFFFI